MLTSPKPLGLSPLAEGVLRLVDEEHHIGQLGAGGNCAEQRDACASGGLGCGGCDGATWHLDSRGIGLLQVNGKGQGLHNM